MISVQPHSMLALYVLCALAQAAHAEKPNSLSEITVEAQRESLQRGVSDFVSHVLKQPSSEQSLALWQVPVCPLVAGLPQQQGEDILEHVSTIASSAGAKLADKDCKPNLFIVATDNPARLLKTWSAKDRELFGEAWPSAVTGFLRGTGAVRVWYNTDVVSSAGNGFSSFDTGGRRMVANNHPQASHIVLDEVLSFSSVIVVIDTTQAKGLKIGAMADYVGMVGLAQINPHADIAGASTILNLFGNPPADSPDSLSPWDQAFLKGIYRTQQSAKLQRSLIIDSMMRDMAP